MPKTLTIYQQILVHETPKTKVRKNKGKGKQPKYRPFTHRVTGYVGGLFGCRMFKSLAAAERFAEGLSNAEITEIKYEN